MSLKICNDMYEYGCVNFAEYNNDDELERIFRKVKTHTGTYFRNVCRECEAHKKRDDRAKKGSRLTEYYWWDYGEMFGVYKSIW